MTTELEMMGEVANEMTAEKRADLAKEQAEREAEEAKVLKPEDIDRITLAYNYWHMHGHPEKAAVLTECLNQDRMPPANLIYFGDLKPETGIDPQTLEVPPRYGPTSSHAAWLKFAKLTTDMEHEILEKMQRKDLIELLEIKGVIPVEEQTSKPDYTTKKPISKPESKPASKSKVKGVVATGAKPGRRSKNPPENST